MKPNEAERSPKKPKETQTGQITPFEAHCHPLKSLETRTTKRSGFNPRWRSLEGKRPKVFIWPHSASILGLKGFQWVAVGLKGRYLACLGFFRLRSASFGFINRNPISEAQGKSHCTLLGLDIINLLSLLVPRWTNFHIIRSERA